MAQEFPRRDVLKASGAGLVGAGLLAAVDVLPVNAETTSDSPPLVFRTSDAVAPGEVAVLFGGGLETTSSVRIATPSGPAGKPGEETSFGTWRTITTLQASENSVKFVVPQGSRPGVVAVDYGGEAPAFLNRPVVHWAQPTRLAPGLGLNEAAPGATIQIIGRNLTVGDAGGASSGGVHVSLLTAGGNVSRLMVTKANPYSVLALIPKALSAGDYRICVHNGSGGPAGWSEPLALTVKKPALWPTRVFNVKDYGARGNDQGDDSAAVRQALDAAKANGGGVVYFPFGTYRLSGWFLIPEYVTVRGDGRDHTSLKWLQQIPTTIDQISQALIYGTGNWAIEKMSISAGQAFGIVYDLSWASTRNRKVPVPELQQLVKPYGQTRDIFLREVRIANNIYQGRPRTDDPRQPSPATGDYRDNVIWADGVTNLEISDCDFIGSQKLTNVRNSRMTNNTYGEGFFALGWIALAGQYAVFEKNTLRGIVGGWGTDIEPVRHIYLAENWVETIMGGFREGLVSDANRLVTVTDNSAQRSAWGAWVSSASGTTVTLKDVTQFAFPADKFATFDILITDGRGAGQIRRVMSSGATTVEIDQPWQIDPDESSLILIFRMQGYITYYDNYCQDSSTLAQLYGPFYDVILSKNTTRRTQGMWAFWGWFTQWIGNDIDHAVTFHGGTGPRGSAAESSPEGNAPYGLIGYVTKGNLTPADNPSPLNPRPPKIPYTYIRGAGFRRNTLSRSNRIVVMFGYGGERTDANHTAAQDVVIDSNTISHSPIGVEVDQNVYRSVVHNTRTKDVTTPVKLWDPSRVTVIGE